MVNVADWFQAATDADPRIHGFSEGGVYDKRPTVTVYAEETDEVERMKLGDKIRSELKRVVTVVWCGKPLLG